MGLGPWVLIKRKTNKQTHVEAVGQECTEKEESKEKHDPEKGIGP